METNLKAKDIWNYCTDILAEGVYIDPRVKKKAIEEISFMINTD